MRRFLESATDLIRGSNPGVPGMMGILYPALSLFCGLLVAQILATLQVYGSNQALYRHMTAIAGAGYLPIPNSKVMATLPGLGPAALGGLFFTLSVGAGLSVLGLVTAALWHTVFKRRRLMLWPLIVLWLGVLVTVNLNGFCPMASTYFVFVPMSAFCVASRFMPFEVKRVYRLTRCMFILGFFGLVICWAPLLGRDHLFTDIRDRLLLSNCPGTKINDFYYRYTRYPSVVLESMNQKLLKTCTLDGVKSPALKRSLRQVLLNHDYLPVTKYAGADLDIVERKSGLVLNHQGTPILSVSPASLRLRPGRVLDTFSSRTDRHVYFRMFTFAFLFIGLPLLVYLLLHTLLAGLLYPVVGFWRASVTASMLCVVGGVVLMIPLHRHMRAVTSSNMARILGAEAWQERIEALKTIQKTGAEISRFEAYARLPAGPYVPERYWFVKALGASRTPETYTDLLKFLHDPHPNVVAVTFHSLAMRNDRDGVSRILKAIQNSDHWYIQRYAYRALRALGWTQSPKAVVQTIRPS